MARKKKIEIFKLEDRVLFEAAGAVEAIAAESLAEDANPDQQNEISESERQEKEAQSVAKDAGPATVNEPGKTVQEVGGGLFQKKSEQQNPNQVLPDDHAVFSARRVGRLIPSSSMAFFAVMTSRRCFIRHALRICSFSYVVTPASLCKSFAMRLMVSCCSMVIFLLLKLLNDFCRHRV